MKRGFAITATMFATILAATLILTGCGGGKYASNSDTTDYGSNTPPPVNQTYNWHTSFEESEGYGLGNLDGQNGWRKVWHPRGEIGSITITEDMAATGSRCVKFDYPEHVEGAWWQNCISISSPGNIVPDIPLRSITMRFKMHRDPGETEFPAGSGQMHPNIWFNQFALNYWNRYIDFGDADQDMKIHALLNNSTPRTFDDAGIVQITGRFVELVIRDDYRLGARNVWYDGRHVANVPIMNPSRLYGSGFDMGYVAVNPKVASILGKPMYIDDLCIDWEPEF